VSSTAIVCPVNLSAWCRAFSWWMISIISSTALLLAYEINFLKVHRLQKQDEENL
jgi:hypothetical protein